MFSYCVLCKEKSGRSEHERVGKSEVNSLGEVTEDHGAGSLLRLCCASDISGVAARNMRTPGTERVSGKAAGPERVTWGQVSVSGFLKWEMQFAVRGSLQGSWDSSSFLSFLLRREYTAPNMWWTIFLTSHVTLFYRMLRCFLRVPRPKKSIIEQDGGGSASPHPRKHCVCVCVCVRVMGVDGYVCVACADFWNYGMLWS